MQCLIINGGSIFGYKNMTQIARFPEDEAFVIDMDALNRYQFNFKLYSEISKYIEFTLMAYPYKENDLIDLMISGASRVVINNTLDDEKLRNFFDITDELVMRCSTPMDIRRFNEFGGNMYLTCRIYDRPGLYFYYGPFHEINEKIIWLSDYPDSLKYDC
ncbi:hypothetical protein ACNF40_04020 [Cuniculiplasma sp. SKW4]|uniref:hypothetical protein n=2 Tax=unclassified Cuniculiplasma TaxID=2619706 RepID=UPI003FD1DCCE